MAETVVRLGNVAPLNAGGDRALIGNTITTVVLRPGYDDAEEARRALSTANDPVLNIIGKALPESDKDYALAVAEVNDLYTNYHSQDAPEWVACDEDPELARVLADWFSAADHEVQVGRPESYQLGEGVRHLEFPPLGGGAYGTEFMPFEFSEDFREHYREFELLTNGGRDALHSQHLNTAAPPATFNYMALSANTTAPAATNTTLTGEIATAGGGLIRAQATYAHTAGTNQSTLTKTFTANASDVLPVTIAKIGVFNASSAGTMGYETLLNATATISASGDSLTVTHTLTIG